MEPDYFHYKLNVRVTSRVAERLKGNFSKITKLSAQIVYCPISHCRNKNLAIVLEHLIKPAIKLSMKVQHLSNFFISLKVFCEGL